MATANPFDLLIDDDAGDPSALIAAYELKLAAADAKTKPMPPAEAVRDARNEGGRGGHGHSRGHGAGGNISNREISFSNGNGMPSEGNMAKPYEKRNGFDDGRGRGGRRGGFSNGVVDGERPKRNYERHSGTGRGSEIKRDGAGRGNWGAATDVVSLEVEEPVAENEVTVADEKPAELEENVDAEKESTVNMPEEEPEEKQLTLEEYEKIREEKRKTLLSLNGEMKGDGRKVDVEEFQSMQLVSKKKIDDDVFIKLGSEKDKRREAAEREEKAKKSVNLNEFLKPAEGEAHYRSGGRGRGRGGRGGRYGGGGYAMNNVSAPKDLTDQSEFPTLGGK